MIFGRKFFAPVAALGIACGTMAFGAVSKSDSGVQTLANFPSLQKLSCDNRALRKFLDGIAATYKKMGYDSIARELRRSGSLISLFGHPERSEKPGTLKQARAALRRLKQAMEDNNFIKLPAITGGKIPDFLGIAVAFVDAADIAIKNLSLGKNVANTLRNNKDSFWLENKGNNTFTGDFTGTFSIITGGGLKIGAGTFDIPAGFTFGGTLSLDGATSDYRSSFGGLGGSFTSLGGGSFYGVVVTDPSGSGIISAGSFSETSKKVALPPGVPLPIDLDYFIETFSAAEIVDGVTLAAGTRIVYISKNFVTPPGAIDLPGKVPLYVASGGGNSFAEGTGNLTFHDDYPNNTFYPLYISTLVGAVTTLKASSSSIWIYFPPGVTIPVDLVNDTLLLGRDYSTGGVLLPTETRIIAISNSSVIPDGAAAFPPGDVVLAPVPISTP